jgi:hypothetical protein
MNFILKIMLDGLVRYSAAYRPENMSETASMLHEHLPALREQHRVAVYVRHQNVLHLIVTE